MPRHDIFLHCVQNNNSLRRILRHSFLRIVRGCFSTPQLGKKCFNVRIVRHRT